MNGIYALISVVVISLISVLVALPFLIKKEISKKTLLFLLSLSVGVLLSTVFIDFLPHAFEHADEGVVGIALIILLGFLVMFVLEKLIHWHHSKKCESHDHGHSHAYSVAPINLIGDGIHNFIDGLVIAGAYAVNVAVGISATISILFHELPQELADFGVLLYSGMQKKKAILFNLLSGVTAILGTMIGLVLIRTIEGFTDFIVLFAAGNFLYIAASNLLPQLHRHCKLKDTFVHVLAIILGIAVVAVLTLILPGHIHG